MSDALIIHTTGEVQRLPRPDSESEQLRLIQISVGGWAERLPCAFHALYTHEAYLNEDGLDRLPINWPAHRLLGMPAEYMPPCGAVIVVPLPEGETQAAERAHPCEFFKVLDAVALGLATAAEAGLGSVIDAR